MSSLIVQVRQIEAINPHLNSDHLELLTIGGWQAVEKKQKYKQGGKVLLLDLMKRGMIGRLGVLSLNLYLRTTLQGKAERIHTNEKIS